MTTFYMVFWGCKYILEIKFGGTFHILETFHIKKREKIYLSFKNT